MTFANWRQEALDHYASLAALPVPAAAAEALKLAAAAEQMAGGGLAGLTEQLREQLQQSNPAQSRASTAPPRRT